MNPAVGLDTNVCLRLVRFESPFSEAIFALRGRLRVEGVAMVCAEATVREVYRIVTGETNGYSLDVATGLAFLDELRRDVEPLRADASTHERWREILVRNNVLGRRVHDAHIAATLLSHGVTTVVTLDAKFRFTGLDARTPAELLAALGAVRQEDRERDPDQ